MTCHAYVKDNFMEHWVDHVKNTLTVFDDCFMDIVPILSSRLGISEADAAAIAKLSVAFHDLGKTLNAYQLNCTKIPCSESNYYGHEVVGAFIVDKLISTLTNAQCLKDSEISKYRYLIVLSVMMHHHAMRDLSDWWIRRVNMVNLLDKLGKWVNTLGIDKLRICDECVNDICSILKSILGDQCNLCEVTKDFADELTWNNPMDLIKDLTNWFMNNKDQLVYRKDQLLILGPLIVSDNEAANRNRGGSKNRHSLISYELRLKCK